MNESIPGWVYTKASLDFEKEEFYKLTVLAFDHGEPQKEASMEYTIEVEDENEFAPVFEGGGKGGGYSFQMYGDLEVGSIIGNVSSLIFYKFSLTFFPVNTRYLSDVMIYIFEST